MLIATLFVALQVAAPTARNEPPLPLGAEGPLQNDVFLPVDAETEQHAALGDRLLEQSRAAAERDAARVLVEAFQAWLLTSAVRRDGPALVWLASERAPELRRVAEDARAGLLARVDSLAAAELAAWRAHVSADAAQRLAKSGDGMAALRAIEASFPATEPAAHAALRLVDRSIADGRRGDAQRWAARGRRHLEAAARASDEGGSPADERARIGAALDEREAWLRSAADAFVPPPFAGGDDLEVVGSLQLRDPVAEFYATRGLPEPGPGRGVRPGGALLSDGRLAVQSTSRIHVVAVARDGPRFDAVFAPADLLAGLDAPPEAARADGAPGWPLLPASDGRHLLVVHGRAEPVNAFGIEEIAPNALLCIVPPAPAPGPLPGELLPELRWAVSGPRRIAPDGSTQPIRTDAPLANAELQPGPAIVGDVVVAQARTISGELAAWLLGFDLWTGELRWACMLAQGADLFAEGSRFAIGRPRRPAAAPLAVVDGLVLACTHLGSAHLVDPLDGRILWSVKLRRRDASEAGWAGGRPLVTADELVLAPADSDRLYALARTELRTGLRTGPRMRAELVRAVLPIGEGEVLVGATGWGFALLGRAGPEEAAFEVDRRGAERRDAVYLGRSESWRGAGFVAGDRMVACSDRGLYLFDLARELELLDYAWLPAVAPAAARGPGLGGEVVPAGERVWVVGSSAVWLATTR